MSQSTGVSIVFSSVCSGAKPILENIKAPRHWLLLGESTGHQWIPFTKGQWRENVSVSWRHHVTYISMNAPLLGSDPKNYGEVHENAPFKGYDINDTKTGAS